MQKVIMASAAEGSEKEGFLETFLKVDEGYEDSMDQMQRFQNKLKVRIANKSVFNPKLAVSVDNFVAEKLVHSRYLRLKIIDKMAHLQSCLMNKPKYQEGYVSGLASDIKNMYDFLFKTLNDYEEDKDVRFYNLQLEVSRIVSDQKENAKREYFESFKRINDRLEDLVENMMTLMDILNENLAAEPINDLLLFNVATSVEKYLAEKVDYLRQLRLKYKEKMIDLKFSLNEGLLYKEVYFESVVSEIMYIDELLTRTLQDYNGNQDVLLLRKLVDAYQNRKKETNFSASDRLLLSSITKANIYKR